MREILFRGKDRLGIWHHGNLHVDTLEEEDKYYINPRINVDNRSCIKVDKDSVGQSTGINDIDGDTIFEGMTVNQKSSVLGDEDVDFTGEVKFYDGCFWIDNGKDAILLCNEIRENKIIED
jgi:YopX protein.